MSAWPDRPPAPGVTRLIIATGNPDKVLELRAAFGDRPFELLGARDVGVVRFPAEDGDTYEANALIKAAHVATATGLPALADDSGLEVDALRGAPGLYSARFGGEGLSPGERIAHLLARMRDVPEGDRGARFVSVLALATPAGEVRTFEGRCEGRILQGPRGQGGFGYDPVFYSAELGRAFGEATREEKRAVSHRGRAVDALLAWLDGPEGARVVAEPSPEPGGGPP
ncbi:MAG: RdgB/HAM1 family non-canonical purine NTP pyrophosphatase [Trueperaceae bacterium]|nr:RdgB/HAM1 family non-canonical purine NTP pyrophosphatase [Trueperaceae bacterium]